MLWGALGIAIFFATDPYLWPNPLGRLKDSILYHTAYGAAASEVQNAGYPLWQPFIWLNTTPYAWHPQAFYFAVDPLITLAAAFGIGSLWKKQRLYVLWLGDCALLSFDLADQVAAISADPNSAAFAGSFRRADEPDRQATAKMADPTENKEKERVLPSAEEMVAVHCPG